MINGTKPERLKRKDFDYIRSFHPQIYAGIAPVPQFPPEYLTDTDTVFPDQNADGQPYGCTNYTTAALAKILGVIAAPMTLETVTHANAKGGFGVLDSIDAARKELGWFNWRFTIQSTGQLDYFGAFQLAQISGIPEKRAISWGIPWFSSFEIAALNGVKIMPMPTEKELADLKANPNSQSWHNSMLDGWTTLNGELVYRDKSWQGSKVGYIYFPREVINVVQNLYGTVAVTATSTKPPAFASVPLPDWFWSVINSLVGLRY